MAENDFVDSIPDEELPEALSKAFAAIPPQAPSPWVQLATLPPITVQGRPLPRLRVQGLLSALAQNALSNAEPGITLFQTLRQHADAKALDAFALSLLGQWELFGQREDRWAMAATGHLGGDGCTQALVARVRRGSLTYPHTELVLACLAAQRSHEALMALEELSHVPRSGLLKRHARLLLQKEAGRRDLDIEQLCDEIVPDGGLDAHGSRVFDYGPRQMHLVLDAHLTPRIRDDSGRLCDRLPSARRTDDPIKVRKACLEWMDLQKLLRRVLWIQTARLEEAMVVGRRWHPDKFARFLLPHPVMIHLLRLLVLGVYDAESGRLLQTFRITEDRSLADHQDHAFSLPETGLIGVVHPVHLEDAVKAAWLQVVEDYRLIAPFAQLQRRIHRPDPGELLHWKLLRPSGPHPLHPRYLQPHQLALYRWHRHHGEHHDAYIYLKHFATPCVTACILYGAELTLSFEAGHVPADCDPDGSPMLIRDVDPAVLSEALSIAQALGPRPRRAD